MKFKAEFDLDNASFEDWVELQTVLEKMAQSMGYWSASDPKPTRQNNIYDTNGNKIGEWEIE